MQHHKTSTFIAAAPVRSRTSDAYRDGKASLALHLASRPRRSETARLPRGRVMLLSKLFTIADSLFLQMGDRRACRQACRRHGPAAPLFDRRRALTVLYGVLRILMALTQQGRDALFAAVAMNAVRRLAIEVFVHLHHLSLRFHLERKTGGLTRVLERGRNAIETIIRTSMLTAVPTVVEFALIVGALLISFDWRYVAAISSPSSPISSIPRIATNWRIGIRRSMNESDTDANTKAIDSLLNFETVKYFGAERREAARYDKSMARYERLSVRTYVSLAVLNAGQAIIFTLGMVARPPRCASPGIRTGQQHGRRFRAAQPDDAAALSAAQLHGHGLSRHQAGDRRHRGDVRHSRPEPGNRGRAGRARLDRDPRRRCAFENVEFAYDPARPILRGVSFEAPAGHTIAIVGPSGAGKSTISRLLFRFYEPSAGRITIDGQDIRAGHADFAARGDRHGPAGHRAVQRLDPLQYPLRPRRRERRGGAGGRRETRRSTLSSARCRRATTRRSASAA